MKSHIFKTLSAAFFAALLAVPAARAAWYDFAKNESAPEIAELNMAGRQLENLVELLEIYTDELKANRLVVRGKAETTRGRIGAVLVSVDGGANFSKAKLERSGAFLFDFTPVIDKEFVLQVKVLDTTGRGSDPAAGAIRAVLRQDKSREDATTLFYALLDLYKKKDRDGFMALVSENFEGSRASLVEGLESDFANLDSIDIQPSISRVGRTGSMVEIQFGFNRRVQARASGAAGGRMMTDKSRTSMTFIREGETMKLYAMAAPLIFGVASSGEVATSVEPAAQGDQVLTVTAEGDAVKVEQQQTVEGTSDQTASNIVIGTLVVNCSMNSGDALRTCPSVALDTRGARGTLSFVQQRHATNMNSGEISVMAHIDASPPTVNTTGCVWVLDPNSVIRDTGQTDINAVKNVSADPADYQQAIPADNEVTLTVGKVYAVKTPTLYALLRATPGGTCSYSLPPTDPEMVINNVTFEYRIQLSQNPAF